MRVPIPISTPILLAGLLLCAGTFAPPESGAQAHADATVPEGAADADPLAPSREVAARLAAVLVRHGYANVAAAVDGGRIAVTFENTRYRDERRGLREAARLLLPGIGDGQELVLVPTHRAVPLVAVRYAPLAPGLRSVAPDDLPSPSPARVTLDLSDLPPALFDAPRASSSFGCVDVLVHPWFEASFGNYDNPMQSRTGIAPEVRVALRPGLSLSAQALLTLQDDLLTGESRIRPALVTLNQTARLPRNLFVSATVGTFNPDRYGADVEARAYLANGSVSVGAELGLTGAVSYAREGWYRTPMDGRTALVDATWRIARHDLLLRTTAGAFLEDERGVRVDVVRQFGELEIGWFGAKTGGGSNGGVMLRLPLFPAKRPPQARVRLFAADAFRWQYRYRGLVPGGRRFTTGNALEDFGRRLYPGSMERSDDARRGRSSESPEGT